MNWVDILILAVLTMSVGFGIWRGFINEVLSIVAWIAAFIIAKVFAPDVAQWLKQSIESDSLILLLSWIIPFLTTFIVFNLLKLLLVSLITVVGLRPVDRVLGGAFGALKGALLITAGVLVTQLVLARSGEAFKTESKLVPHFQVVALWMLENLDKVKEINIDNAVEKLGNIVNSNKDKFDIDAVEKSLGLTKDEIMEILNDDKKRAELESIIKDPAIMEKLESEIAKSN